MIEIEVEIDTFNNPDTERGIPAAVNARAAKATTTHATAMLSLQIAGATPRRWEITAPEQLRAPRG